MNQTATRQLPLKIGELGMETERTYGIWSAGQQGKQRAFVASTSLLTEVGTILGVQPLKFQFQNLKDREKVKQSLFSVLHYKLSCQLLLFYSLSILAESQP